MSFFVVPASTSFFLVLSRRRPLSFEEAYSNFDASKTLYFRFVNL